MKNTHVVVSEMYGTCSARAATTVAELACTPIDYQAGDFVTEVRRLTGDGVDVVFESIGGKHIWQSRKALRPGGVVVAYGLTGSLEHGRLASGAAPRRNRFHVIKTFAPYLVGAWVLPSRRRIVSYSIQTLERLKPIWFREDLTALFTLLEDGKIKPLVAHRFPLTEARTAQELLGKGGVTGKFVLVCNEQRVEAPS